MMGAQTSFRRHSAPPDDAACIGNCAMARHTLYTRGPRECLSMNVRSKSWFAALIAGFVMASPVLADDVKPQTEEKCIERCDIESDKCMADSEGEKKKVEACDDRYSECLEACDAPGA
jgi:hypothetical protein